MITARPAEGAVPAAGFCERLVRAAGLELFEDASILDFCCGAGAETYQFLDRGYRNVHGFDIRDYVERRSRPPHPVFRFAGAENGITLPFTNDCFDFIYSNQVLEHVKDLDGALAEISRCLKPGAFSLHIFPSKWRPVECHINVPVGGVFTSEAYYRFWARLGVRNRYQAGKPALETAEANTRYARDSLNYLSGSELAVLFRRHFDCFRYMDLEGLRLGSGRGRRLYPLARVFPPLLWLYRFAHTRVVMLFKAH